MHNDHNTSQPGNMPENIIECFQLGYITVEIRETIPGMLYEICTVTSKDGARLVDRAYSINEAQRIADLEIQEITARMEKRRKGKPTSNQLLLLFNLKMAIPLTLTFGQASDLIDAALTEKQERKQRKLYLVPREAER